MAVQGYDEAHGFPHTIRVACNALEIAVEEDADIDVVLAAALLHDVGRAGEDVLGVHHAVLSAELAPTLLRGAGFPVEKIEAVREAILAHSFSLGGRPSTVEACIVSDADKIDALGAIGFYRMTLVSGETGRPPGDTVAHFYEKLRLLPGLMCTRAGRARAERLVERLRVMVEWLWEELEQYEDAIVLATLQAFGAEQPVGKQ